MDAQKSSIHGAAADEAGRELLGVKATVTARNQITLPTKLVSMFDIRKGDVFRFTVYERRGDSERLMLDLVREGRRLMTFRVVAKRTKNKKRWSSTAQMKSSPKRP